jgi:hypothetical protein
MSTVPVDLDIIICNMFYTTQKGNEWFQDDRLIFVRLISFCIFVILCVEETYYFICVNIVMQ